MKKHTVKFSNDKFKSFVRYIIQAAENKRCVPYYEIENIYGLNHGQVGYYAGVLGNYCIENKLPLLNGLIISSTDCIPSEGFDWFQKQMGKHWGQIIHECWKKYHVTSSREKQCKNYGGLDTKLDTFLNSHY